MKIVKAQAEILKELLDPTGRVCYYTDELDETVTVVTKGTVGYRMPQSMLRVDLEGAQTCAPLFDRVVDLTRAIELKPTDHYRLGGKVREYRAFGDEDMPVYIDTKLLANFDVPLLYQNQYSPGGMVTLAEYRIDIDSVDVVGYVCPVRIHEKEE